MEWEILFCEDFFLEFQQLSENAQNELLAHLTVLGKYGPGLGRPWVDTLKGSVYSNMKELRFVYQQVPYRYFFAFDPKRRAVVLVGGSKSNQKRFYEKMIRIADARYARHLQTLEE